MKKGFFVNPIWIFIILIFHISLNANEIYGKDPEMEMYYKKLSSEKFEERKEAVDYFYILKNEKLNDKYMKALIDLLKKENEQYKKYTEFPNKGETAEMLPKEIAYWHNEEAISYLIDLFRIASRSRDKSLLDYVLKNCADPETISNFGEDAVDPIIEALKDAKVREAKTPRIRILAEMLRPKENGYVASGSTRNKIKELLIQYAKDSDRYVRSASVQALGVSRDKDVIPIIDDVAKNDPYFYEKKDESTGKTENVYPVRMKAKEVLEKLKARDR